MHNLCFWKNTIFSLCTIAFAAFPCLTEASNNLYGYDRVIFGGSDLTIPNGDPLPVVDISTLLDPYNHKMLAIGDGDVYNQQDVDLMREEAFDYFLETYGLNFNNAVHDPVSDIYYLPNALLAQVTRISDDPIQFDSQYKKRIGVWGSYEVGVLVVMTSGGNFSGGIRQGLTYFSGDLLSKYSYNFVMPEKDWSNPRYREEVKGYPDWPSRQSPNSFGSSDTFGQIRIVDRNGKTGYLVSVVDRVRQLNGNWTLNGRVIMTWPLEFEE
jgi:hypothetical protein